MKALPEESRHRPLGFDTFRSMDGLLAAPLAILVEQSKNRTILRFLEPLFAPSHVIIIENPVFIVERLFGGS